MVSSFNPLGIIGLSESGQLVYIPITVHQGLSVAPGGTEVVVEREGGDLGGTGVSAAPNAENYAISREVDRGIDSLSKVLGKHQPKKEEDERQV